MFCTPLQMGATGYQVLLQLNDPHNNESFSKLLVGESDFSVPMSIQVNKHGNYHVAVFAVREDRGIMDSVVAFSGEIKVSEEIMLSTSGSSLPPGTHTSIVVVYQLYSFPPHRWKLIYCHHCGCGSRCGYYSSCLYIFLSVAVAVLWKH